MGSRTVRGPGPGRSKRHQETRGIQVFARDLRLPASANLVYLERGYADVLRSDVKAGHLICPIPECEDPRFVVRGGSKRDHFAHKPGAAGHAPETLEHHTAKHLIARWLRRNHPEAIIHVDDQIIDSGQRPDVLAELPEVFKVGYEVQRASMTADEWQARHDRYATTGVKDVWVFMGPSYAPPVGAPTPAHRRLHPALEAVLAVGHPVVYLDPYLEVVALAVGPDVEGHLAARGHRPPEGKGRARVDRWHPLGPVGAPGGVIDIPGTRELVKNLDAKHAAWINNRREEDERAKRAARLAAERDAARFPPLKPAPQRTPVQTGPPRPIQGTFPLVRRLESERIAPEPLEAVPEDLASAFEPTDQGIEDFRADSEKFANEIPIEVLAALPRRLHRVAEVTWYRAVKISPKAHVKHMSLLGVSPEALAAVVSSLVAAGVVKLESVKGEYHYRTTQPPAGGTST